MTDKLIVKGREARIEPVYDGEGFVIHSNGLLLNKQGEWHDHVDSDDRWPTREAALAFIRSLSPPAVAMVECPECHGSGESGLIPLHVRPVEGHKPNEQQLRDLAARMAVCQFCNGQKTVPPERLEWRAIGEAWRLARRAIPVGMREWADRCGCLPSDYCYMEAGRIRPDDRYSPLAHSPPSQLECPGCHGAGPQYDTNACDGSAIESMRQLVLSQFDRLQWRHHGIGVLQAYLFEHSEPEVRVHVWHPSLARDGISESGDCHDHRFDLRSTVMAGCLEETYYGCPAPSEDGEWSMYVVENARAAGPDKKFDGACNPLPGRFTATGTNHRYPSGTTYTHPRGTFHRTRVRQLAVTLCVMSKKQGRARLLVPFGREPVHAFGEPASEEIQSRILADAKSMLSVQPPSTSPSPAGQQRLDDIEAALAEDMHELYSGYSRSTRMSPVAFIGDLSKGLVSRRWTRAAEPVSSPSPVGDGEGE
jgi:hypothetical protein